MQARMQALTRRTAMAWYTVVTTTTVFRGVDPVDPAPGPPGLGPDPDAAGRAPFFGALVLSKSTTSSPITSTALMLTST